MSKMFDRHTETKTLTNSKMTDCISESNALPVDFNCIFIICFFLIVPALKQIHTKKEQDVSHPVITTSHHLLEIIV